MENVNNRAKELLLTTPQQKNWGARRASKIKKYNTTTKTVANYVVLDFETTGFRAGADRIIQIGAIKYMQHQQTDLFSTLVKPNRYIPLSITQLTGITNEMVATMPTIEETIQSLIDFIGEFPIIAHNASFDMGFLYALEVIEGIEIPQYTVIDTVKLARKIILNTPNHKLTTLTEFLQLEHDAHDAIGDCLATAAIYQYCIRGILN